MGGVLGPGGGCDFCPRVIHPHLGCYLRRLGLVKIYIYIYIYIYYIYFGSKSSRWKPKCSHFSIWVML